MIRWLTLLVVSYWAGLAAQARADGPARHWAYRPLQETPVPASPAPRSVRSPIDPFIDQAQANHSLTAAPTASAATLIRRLYFDVLGLPPSPEAVATFVDESAQNPSVAVTSLIDRLLSDPHYGERWGRHWLDVARYADSDGQEGDLDRPTAYRFRDFVIRSLNEDRPFDEFVRWQLAGDELEPDHPEALAATGFIVAGPHAVLPDNLMEEERIRTRFNELDDMLATTGSAMLGLTLACARCHDHKYDPVSRRDYYRLLCAFNGGDRAEVPLGPWPEVQRRRAEQQVWKAELDAAQAQLTATIQSARKRYEATARSQRIDSLSLSAEERTRLRDRTDSPETRALEKRLGKQLQITDADLRPHLTDAERAEWDAREAARRAVEARRPAALPTALAFADFSATPRETFHLSRGDFRSPAERVELGFITALTTGRAPTDYWAEAQAQRRRPDSTQQRRALAQWMTDVEHGAGALVARVIVNRVWQHHFGQGLVRTVSDFGTRADPPSHPELLEWLAHTFVRGGWRLKPLHRLILNSRVYQQAIDFQEANARRDPENRLLWRQRPRRLEAEVLRDALLAVSGTLDPRMYGPAVKVPIPAEAMQARNVKDPYPTQLRDTPDTHRRSVYLFHKRVVPVPLLQAFDGPDAQASCGRREPTTVAPQALALLNDPFVRARAEDFAQRLAREAGAQPTEQVRRAWALALGRLPSSEEQRAAEEFLNTQRATREARGATPAVALHQALTDFCQSVFSLNEFVYID